jgi:hypothetical protein
MVGSPMTTKAENNVKNLVQYMNSMVCGSVETVQLQRITLECFKLYRFGPRVVSKIAETRNIGITGGDLCGFPAVYAATNLVSNDNKVSRSG